MPMNASFKSNNLWTRANITGHERSLTQIVFNAEGDLLFSASKDKIVNAWYTSNGERVGTYNGHNGSVWSVACDCALERSGGMG
jgi:WD40 repeat protein